MRSRDIRRLAGIGLLLASLILLGWSLWPTPAQSLRVDLSAEGGVEAPDGLRLALHWPGFVRLGDTAEIRLELDGHMQTSGDERSSVAPELLTARLDLPGLVHTPGGETSQTLPPDRPAIFRWTVRADQPGEYAGTVWVYRGAAGDQAAVSRRVASAQRFALRAGALLGLSARWAQALGLSGGLIGAVFGLDGVVLWFSRRFRIQ
jgi:hypothetical protein